MLGFRRPRRGFTLVELILGLGVLSVLVALAVPSMADYIQRKRVDGAANELLTSLRYARTLALQNGNAVWVSFGSGGDFSCYAVHTAPGLGTCNCGNWPADTCSIGLGPTAPTTYKTAILSNAEGVALSAVQTDLRFNPAGFPNNAATLTVNLTSSRGGALRVLTNGAGRPSICSVSGHPTYPSCE